MHSLILSFFGKIFSCFGAWLKKKRENSFFCAIFRAICRWFDRSYSNSFFVKKLSAPGDSDEKYKARYGKISQFLRRFLSKLFSPLAQSAQNSRICNMLSCFVSNLHRYSLRVYGIPMFFAGIGSLIGCFIYQSVSLVMIFAVAMLFLGTLFIFTKNSVSELVAQSFFLKIGHFSVRGERTESSYKVPVVIGAILAVLFAATDTLPVLLALVAVIGVAFAFYYTELCLIAYTFVLPFMPTMIMVAGVIGLVIVYLTKTLFAKEKFIPQFSSLSLFVFLFGCVYIWGVINSYAKISSAKSVLVYLAFMLVYYLIINLLSDEKRLWNVFRMLCIASIPCALVGLYQYLYPDDLNVWVDQEMFEDISGRIVSLFENPNVYGEYLIVMIMINLGVVIKSERIISKLFYLGTLALNVLCVLLTYSRGCWIGVAVALMVFLFIRYRKWFIVAIGIGIIGLFFLPESIMNRVLSIGNLSDSSTSYRMYIWEGTVHMLQDFWATGVGVGSDAFNHIYPIYSYGAISAPHPHNLYLLILAETGIVGLIVFIALICVLVKKLFVTANRSQNSFLRTFAAILLSATIGFLIQGVFDNVWYNYRLFLFFFIVVGLSAAVCLADKRTEAQNND